MLGYPLHLASVPARQILAPLSTGPAVSLSESQGGSLGCHDCRGCHGCQGSHCYAVLAGIAYQTRPSYCPIPPSLRCRLLACRRAPGSHLHLALQVLLTAAPQPAIAAVGAKSKGVAALSANLGQFSVSPAKFSVVRSTPAKL